MDDSWAPGSPTPRADVLAVREQTRRYSIPFDEMLRRRQALLVDALHEAQESVARQARAAGISLEQIEIVTEQESALGDPVIRYTVSARWKESDERR